MSLNYSEKISKERSVFLQRSGTFFCHLFHKDIVPCLSFQKNFMGSCTSSEQIRRIYICFNYIEIRLQWKRKKKEKRVGYDNVTWTITFYPWNKLSSNASNVRYSVKSFKPWILSNQGDTLKKKKKENGKMNLIGKTIFKVRWKVRPSAWFFQYFYRSCVSSYI